MHKAAPSRKKKVFSGNRPEKSKGWTRWKILEPSTSFTPRSLAETLDGGQAFRWKLSGHGEWTGIWGRSLAKIRLATNGDLQWKCPSALEKPMLREIKRYFGTDRDYQELIDKLPWKSDLILHAAMRESRGLRILRQPLGETLFCFLCSSNKQIVQIKQICETAARRLGQRIAEDDYSLPDWKTLLDIPEVELRLCKAGYRAKYIKQTAQALANDPGFLNRLQSLPYPEAHKQLRRLPGVGQKVADCVLLFGAGRLESFPVDVWIEKAMRRQYHLEGWKREQIAHFGRAHFGPLAGLAQQFLFAGERQRT